MVSVLSKRVSWVSRLLGFGIWGFVHEIWETGKSKLIYGLFDASQSVIFPIQCVVSEVISFWNQGKAKKVVQAQNLWFEILKSQIETGTPYMLYKVSIDSKFSLFFVIYDVLLLPWFILLANHIVFISHFQDTCNRKSNQQNLGTIKSSNLCTEIIEYTSPTETAVCNLASIALPRYVREKVTIRKHWIDHSVWYIFIIF